MLRKTLMLTEKFYKEIEEAKCATFSVLMERLRATRSELFYVLDKLRQEGRVEAVNLGRVALWCACPLSTPGRTRGALGLGRP